MGRCRGRQSYCVLRPQNTGGEESPNVRQNHSNVVAPQSQKVAALLRTRCGGDRLGWVQMSKRDLQRIGVLTEVLAGRRTTESAAGVSGVSVRQT